MKTRINELADNQKSNNERRNTMKRIFTTIATVFVLAALFIAPVPASAFLYQDSFAPISKPYFNGMILGGYGSSIDGVLLGVTPLAGLAQVDLSFVVSPNGDGSYVGTTTESYYGWPLEFHLWVCRWGNYAFVRILTSCNGVFFDDRNEIFILTGHEVIVS